MRSLTIAFVGLLLCVCACKSTKTIEVPTTYIMRDTVRQNTFYVDSLYMRDSIYVEGEKIYKERIIYKNKILFDTLYIVRTDTIKVPQPYPVEKEVQRPLPWYDNLCKHLGRLCVIAALLWILFLYIKRKR